MIIAHLALGYALVVIFAQALSVSLAMRKCRKRDAPLAPPPDAPPVSVVQPLCGIEPFSEETLKAVFALDYPAYELLFCLARADDPVKPLVRRAMASHPTRPARLLIGDERPSANPKLNNIVKGWKAARHDWIVVVDSNVLTPRDYLQRLAASWRADAGIVCAPPIGSAPASMAAELECAFLNTYQARWQYAGEACGFGFAQGKSMLWRRDILERAGGIERLGDEIAEDAAATKLVHRAGLKAYLVEGPFEQPLGRRSWSDVWSRQLRWARLRRATFPLIFIPEIFSSGLFAILAACLAAPALGWPATVCGSAAALVWYGSEAVLAYVAGWRFSRWMPLAFALRDAALPLLWLQAWTSNRVEWRGHAMSVADGSLSGQAPHPQDALIARLPSSH